jgi:cell division septum initiation protein DivIVA
MIPITLEALLGQTFSKTETGYDPAEVDALIHRLTESYSVLYRENAALLKQLRETEDRLRTIEDAKKQAEQILQTAQAQKDKIIEEAYLKADSILATVQMNCESVLRGFKEKAEAHEKVLLDMKKSILKFKSDLFEQYRLQVELIENMFPDNGEEQNWTPDAYAQHIVSELKRKFSDQYEIFPETQMEFSFWNECKQACDPEKQKKSSTPEQNICHHPHQKKKISKKVPSVMDLIEEYEGSAVKAEAKSSSSQQFMLDFDHPSEQGVVIDKQT